MRRCSCVEMVTCLGSPSCTLKPELPDDMGMRRCGGAHPADTPRQKNKHGFTPGENTQARSRGSWKDTIQDATEKIKFDASYAPPQCQSLRGSFPSPDIGGALWRRACFLSSSVRAFVELVVCLAFPFMTSSVRLSFAAAHFSCGRISCSQSDQSGKPFFLQAKKHPLGSLTYHEQCGGALPKPFAFFAFLRLEDPGGPRRQGDVKRLSP